MSTGLRAAAILAAGVLPGVALAGAIDGAAPVIAAVLAALGATLVTAAVRRAAAPSRTTAAMSVALLGGALAAIALATALAPTADDRPLVRAAPDAIWHGWAAVATSTAPADPAPRVLVPIALTVFAATAAAQLLARDRAAGLRPLLPQAVAVLGACVAAGRHQYAPLAVGGALAAVAALLLLTGTDRPHRRAPRPSVTAIAAVAGVALIGATAAAPLLAAGRDADPFDPRDHWQPPTSTDDAVSPLDLVAAWLQRPETELFTIAADRPVATRLAVFDTFDGARWTTSSSYRPAARRIAAPDRLDVERRPVTARITPTGLDGPWLPSIADVLAVEGAAVLVDPTTATLLRPDAGRGAAPAYELHASMPVPGLDSLQQLPIDAGALTPATTLPAELTDVAATAVAGATTPLAQAVLLERYLRLNYHLDPAAPGGHAIGHLVRTLTVTHAGTSEQFATAFAVLGRSLGLPTRVVVGFAPGTPTGEGHASVRGGDVHVWAEVAFDRVGWTAFDPTPTGAADTPDDGSASGGLGIGLGGQERAVEAGDDTSAIDTVDLPPPTDTLTASATTDADGPPWAVILAAVGAAIIVGVTLIPVVKRRRTRRRRTMGDPRRRVLGAWDDVLDRLTESGLARPAQQTVGELVSLAPTTLAGMYRPVCRALYDDAPLLDSDADQAWRCRDRFVQVRRHDAGPLTRVRWHLSPPRRRRHATTPVQRPTTAPPAHPVGTTP